MLIDWFTVIAQVVNFLILVWLLKRFLYRPILDAIDAREKSIAAQIADAQAKKVDAQKQQDEYQSKNSMFDKEHDERMTQVMEDAKNERIKLFDLARSESDDLRKKLEQALVNEQHSLNEGLVRRARDEVFAVARKTLSDLAGISLEERMTDIFIARLRELNPVQTADFRDALNSSSAPLVVSSVFRLPAQQCSAIEAEITQILGKQKQIEFDTAPDRISGIEITAGGQKIAWSIAGYLEALTKSVDALLKASVETERTEQVNMPEDVNEHGG